MTARIRIGRLPVDVIRFDESLDRIEQLVAEKRGACVFTPNVDHVMLAEHDPRLVEAYAVASLSLADGMPLLWAARLLGSPLPEKISGSDLVWPLMDRAARRGFGVYLLGGAPGSAEKAAKALVAQLPGLRLVGIDAPRIDLDMPSTASLPILERIAAARPDLVLVGFGAPKQEIWIHSHLEMLRPAVTIAVGAAIDFLAGQVPRAPRWMSRVGAEWLYRLGREPRRLAYRYLVRDVGFGAVLARALGRRIRSAATGAAAVFDHRNDRE
jgi:N-acetylglucosaminyldiphosphoundecaprenol N-acetyl-beta-D-mannosaminyltransferase